MASILFIEALVALGLPFCAGLLFALGCRITDTTPPRSANRRETESTSRGSY